MHTPRVVYSNPLFGFNIQDGNEARAFGIRCGIHLMSLQGEETREPKKGTRSTTNAWQVARIFNHMVFHITPTTPSIAATSWASNWTYIVPSVSLVLNLNFITHLQGQLQVHKKKQRSGVEAHNCLRIVQSNTLWTFDHIKHMDSVSMTAQI